MIELDIQQGEPEWFAARCGIPTASNFAKIITTRGEKSKQAEGYMNSLIAEALTGNKESVKQTEWMERGIELEEEARRSYEFITEREIREIGFCFKDEAKNVGCSPDGLGEDRGLEIKCPAPGTHVGYLLAEKLPTTYFQQVHGSMWVTGFGTWDFMSWHPDMEPMILTIERNEKFCTALDEIMPAFIDEMKTKLERLKK